MRGQEFNSVTEEQKRLTLAYLKEYREEEERELRAKYQLATPAYKPT
jgi:hypothetical protein